MYVTINRKLKKDKQAQQKTIEIKYPSGKGRMAVYFEAIYF